MTIAWLAVVLVCLLMYVVLDGYDLGVGVGVLFERNAAHRRRMLESVAVGWDGNESWLILLAVSLFAGFPLAFGTVLPHAYLPLIVMLIGLVVRGVSVEMTSQAPPASRWTTAFGVGSLVAGFCQGFALGTLTSAMRIVDGAFTGSTFGAFGWFPVLSGLTLTAAYTALGYAYTKQKSSGALRLAAGRRGRIATAVTAALLLVLLLTINGTAAPLDLGAPERAFTFWILVLFAAAGGVTAAVTFGWTRRTGAADTLPIAGLTVTTVATFLAVLAARYPVIVPPGLTTYTAASPASTMTFLLIAILLLNMPLILAYNVFAHRAFRGKVGAGPPVGAAPAGHDHVGVAGAES
jgi:cytochrome d ubiquinol oxidase subunit II